MTGNNLITDVKEHYLFNFIDIGARWGIKPNLSSFKNIRYIGFEPDQAEYKNLCQNTQNSPIEYFPYALGNKNTTQKLYITKSPDWSSLIKPLHDTFQDYKGMDTFSDIVEECNCTLKTLDTLATEERLKASFIKLDVQGTEHEVLDGAKSLLNTTVLGVEVEVEFTHLYKDQKLFHHIHEKMLAHNFLLFNLTRNNCIRKSFPFSIETPGQLLWSDAIYLKNYRKINTVNTQDLVALFLLSFDLGFYDYAFDILVYIKKTGIISHDEYVTGFQLFKDKEIAQKKDMFFVSFLSKYKFGRACLNYLVKILKKKIPMIISYANPEKDFYFRRT